MCLYINTYHVLHNMCIHIYVCTHISYNIYIISIQKSHAYIYIHIEYIPHVYVCVSMYVCINALDSSHCNVACAIALLESLEPKCFTRRAPR